MQQLFISAILKSRCTRLVKPSHQLREMNDSDTNVFMHGLIDRYAARPAGEPFDNMTLAHFAVWYNTVSGTYNEGENCDDSSGRLPCFQLQNSLRMIVQRRHQACLRVPIMAPESHGDYCYYHLLLLYHPWREETLDLLGDHGTAQEALLAKRDQLQFLN